MLRYFSIFFHFNLPGNAYTIVADNDYVYRSWFDLSRKNTTFYVTSCVDVCPIISSASGQLAPAYQYVIGGFENTLSLIRDGADGNILTQRDTISILRCHERQAFWLQWSNTTITSGSGRHVGQHSFLQYENTAGTYPITSIGLGHWYNGKGKYEFLDEHVGKKSFYVLKSRIARFSKL